jgi:hypothetical protein
MAVGNEAGDREAGEEEFFRVDKLELASIYLN